ncbi:hypothetical protein GA0061098_1005338 [Bradyrhizobium shewense]|uniref:Uncharacterized protein n=1 Tax=Bradyrhizobium shewense TaxID=1761772 RepID=A0A1C3VVV0_9BRAD|nr:hypothetical protein GA0061098_1005338 [Bradyrhizobium shewense]
MQRRAAIKAFGKRFAADFFQPIAPRLTCAGSLQKFRADINASARLVPGEAHADLIVDRP